MQVIIVGAGAVGETIAANLADGHDVTVVEKDPAIVEELTYSLDVMAVEGDGTDLAVLEAANLEETDMVIACTNDDDTNIVACGAARTAGSIFTIARVARHSLLRTWQRSIGAFGVDFMVCTDLLAAEAIVRISGLPGAHDVDTFANGLIRMAEMELEEESPLVGQTLSTADRETALTFGAIFRNEDLIVPHGDTRFEGGDRVVVIGGTDAVRSFADELSMAKENTSENGHPDDKPNRNPTSDSTTEVVIAGGSELGYHTARLYAEFGIRVRLIESDPDRARTLSEQLPQTTVLENDATDVEFLEREHVDEADVVVACLGNDEKNLLVSLLADKLGVDRTITVVERPEYTDLFETVGVDVAINPREETAEEIIRFSRGGRTENVSIIEHDQGEVLEVVLDTESVLLDRPIEDAVDDLPDGVVIGAIARNGTLVTPRGDTTPEVGDHVVMFVDATVLDDVIKQV